MNGLPERWPAWCHPGRAVPFSCTAKIVVYRTPRPAAHLPMTRWVPVRTRPDASLGRSRRNTAGDHRAALPALHMKKGGAISAPPCFLARTAEILLRAGSLLDAALRVLEPVFDPLQD